MAATSDLDIIYRLEITVHLPFIAFHGKRRFTFPPACVAASRILRQSNSRGNVSYGRHPWLLSLLTIAAYDARLVDIWACGIVYYCMHFQELPWRVAQPSEMLYASYVQAAAKTDATNGPFPATLSHLLPRNCRPIIRKMLEPDPKKRWTVKDVMSNGWMEGVEVCTIVEKPTHVHAHVRAMLHQHMEKLAEQRREREWFLVVIFLKEIC